MGYTHYFKLSEFKTYGAWAIFKKLVKRVLTLERERGILFDKVDINDKSISFNGSGEDSHETFFIGKFESGLHFCKTNRKPYNTAVVACLEIALQLNIIEDYSSDGGQEESRELLKEGRDLAKFIFVE